MNRHLTCTTVRGFTVPRFHFARILVAILFLTVGNSRTGAQTEVPGVIYESGFYNVEHLKDKTWRWMDEEGVIQLQNARQDMVLKITGRAPVDAKSPTMTIFLNGEQLEQFTPTAKLFDKEYKIPAAKMRNGIWSEFKITTTKFIVPSQVDKKLTDDRRLGFKLYALTWQTVAGVPVETPGAGPQVPEPPPPGVRLFWIVTLIVLISLAGFLGLALALWLRASKTDPGQDAQANKPAGKQAAKKDVKPRPKPTE